MAHVSEVNNTQWSSRFAFLMAAVGSSVGLGNLWRFSAQAGDNGGGAFIVIYLLCILLIGIPVLMSEYIIGRAGNGGSAVNSITDLAARSSVNSKWSALAWMGTLSAFLIVSFYCVVAAWVMLYIPKFLTGAFVGQSAEQIAAQFDTARANKPVIFLYVFCFLGLSSFFVARGVKKGIELASKLLMPIFFLLLVGLSVFSLYIGLQQSALMADGSSGNGTKRALEFMFNPDFSKISANVIVSALGQAFFSIGLGSATMITYGSYLPKSISIPKSSLVIGLTDTAVALIAGLAIFPIVFAFNLDSAGGAGLFFKTLPVALTTLPGGTFMGTAFFTLALFAALTTAIALFEVVTAFLIDRFNLKRLHAVGYIWMSALLLSVGSVFSDSFMTLLDEKITGAIMVPLSGLLAITFVGWKMDKKLLADEIGGISGFVSSILLFLMKILAPICVGIVLIVQVVQAFF